MHNCDAICRRILKEEWDTRAGKIRQRIFWNDLGVIDQRAWLSQTHGTSRHALVQELQHVDKVKGWRRMIAWFGSFFSHKQKEKYLEMAIEEECPTCGKVWDP